MKRRKDEKTKAKRRKDESEKTLNSGLHVFVISLFRLRYFVLSPSLFRLFVFSLSSFRLFAFVFSSFRYGAFVMSPRNNEKTKWHKSATIAMRSRRMERTSRDEKQELLEDNVVRRRQPNWNSNCQLHWCRANVGTIGYLHPNMAACETGWKFLSLQYSLKYSSWRLLSYFK